MLSLRNWNSFTKKDEPRADCRLSPQTNKLENQGTDENLEIVGKVKARLVGDKEIWSTNIDIKSIQCRVVLYGLVGSKKEINKAIAHAKSVEGVRGVKSFLTSVK
jgi:osmotically-inducible protein OsmY